MTHCRAEFSDGTTESTRRGTTESTRWSESGGARGCRGSRYKECGCHTVKQFHQTLAAASLQMPLASRITFSSFFVHAVVVLGNAHFPEGAQAEVYAGYVGPLAKSITIPVIFTPAGIWGAGMWFELRTYV